ncbi:iron export ABC transporter permease subunit FetB [Synechococcus sp. PCC 7336]|uniref:ABC transporter permease n=1 Tax=Synechococcus sp. PCC 7336 TaxID=195250 RepID=UPI00034A226E|nr:iron export ABC transporter permease subunit FetB [Synechococcus sp. PCC 7336]
MPDAYLQIGYGQVALASLAILANLGLSIGLRLGLTQNFIVASVRMTVQLLLLGLALGAIFALDTPYPVLAVGLLMATLAGISAVNRTRRRFPGIYWDSLVSVIGSAGIVTGFMLLGVIQVDPWFDPQYFVPLLGMVLGNTLNSISLALDRFMEGVASQRDLVEAKLALGATRWEAAHSLIRESLRTATIPLMNSMMVMGVVSLPGMMTGQILAGATPVDAVRYQIAIVFAIASATALGALGVTLLAYRSLLNDRHQLCLDRLSEAA